ncbi:MAG: PAS domain S-box protein [Verrucomicrobiales bacterium]|nr:PAS domain S-box protein [Verrucomicrobiales bacterium]
MASVKTSFVDKVLGRLTRLDADNVRALMRRLAEERSLLETVFNIVEDGIVVTDDEGKVIYLNQSARRLLGLGENARAEGEPIQQLLPELEFAKLKAMDQKGGTPVVRQEFEVTWPRPRFFRLFAAPIDGEASGSNGLALILNDATEARQKEFETVESERIQALTLLAASLAHEIGNPLNALNIHLQLMDRELRRLRRELTTLRSQGQRTPRGRPAPLDAEHAAFSSVGKLEQFVGVARGEIGRLDYIVSQFLQALRPSAPKQRTAELNATVRETLDLLRPELDNRGLLVAEELADRLPPAYFDPDQIKQVLVNLIRNAMQAMTRGGLLTLASGTHADGHWFSVGDTGGGIPQETMNQLFKPFHTTKKKGTGLGLMIVQRIVRSHHGRIDVESHLNRGTRFRIWLPGPTQVRLLPHSPPTS